jgi:hypothetical protein
MNLHSFITYAGLGVVLLFGSVRTVSACPPAAGAVQWRSLDGGNGHWYLRVGTPTAPPQLGWDAARAAAEAMGGHLVTITSAAENAFVQPMLIDGYFNVYLLGGYRVGSEWHWVTGEPWDYTNWYGGEPNNANGNEYYLASWVTPGTWNDVWSTYEGSGYIVEWDAANGCAGDINDDCAVNGIDLAYVLADWGSTSTRSDLNSDGAINGIDLEIILNGWGACP